MQTGAALASASSDYVLLLCVNELFLSVPLCPCVKELKTFAPLR